MIMEFLNHLLYRQEPVYKESFLSFLSFYHFLVDVTKRSGRGSRNYVCLQLTCSHVKENLICIF